MLRAKRDYNSSKEFTSLNDRSLQNCKRYSTINNEFSLSISLQHKQHQKFSANLYRKQENRQIWYGNSDVSSTVSLGESTH